MEIKIIASGSKGNCYRISDGITVLMIECGISFKKIREAFDFGLSEVAGCLISHEHGDHSKSIKSMLKYGIDCYLSNGTNEKLSEKMDISSHHVHTIKSNEQFRIGSFQIMPFDTNHDAVEPLGFLIQSDNGEKLVFLTDTYYCRHLFKDVNYFMVECNYSLDILDENIKDGLVHPARRNRIMSSHFELQNVKEFFSRNKHENIREIYLIHLSGDNADPELFKDEIRKVTGVPVYV